MNNHLLTRTLHWLPVILLLSIAANHFYLVNSQSLSPWLGGGFGMFANTDVDSTRVVFVTIGNDKGDEYPVTLEGEIDKLQQRVRGLPDNEQLTKLAMAVWKSLEQDRLEENTHPMTSLRIEVWKTIYHAETLQPQQIRIAHQQFSF